MAPFWASTLNGLPRRGANSPGVSVRAMTGSADRPVAAEAPEMVGADEAAPAADGPPAPTGAAARKPADDAELGAEADSAALVRLLVHRDRGVAADAGGAG